MSGVTIFCSSILEDGVVQHRISQQPLELGVLVQERLQLACSGHLQPAILGLPFVEGGAADPVLAAQIGRSQPGLLLLQDPDDLLFVEPAALHPIILPRRRTLAIWRRSRAQVIGSSSVERLS